MSNLVGRNGERVKLKIFALLIAFQFNCFRGEEDHLKAAIALLVNKQSATFSLREKSGFSPRLPNSPWLAATLDKLKR